jgi:ArsR family transcriptional regulator, arsenate/arsenite/antimonite-responsive transcriptional repressor
VVDASVVEVSAAQTDVKATRRLESALPLLCAVADPVRWTVLQVLASRQACVCDLQEHVPIAANLLSYHLRVLRDVGLVGSTRRGRWIDYSLTEGALERLHDALPRPVLPDRLRP